MLVCKKTCSTQVMKITRMMGDHGGVKRKTVNQIPMLEECWGTLATWGDLRGRMLPKGRSLRIYG